MLLILLVLAQPFPTSFTARQGRSLDGGMTAWAVECTNCLGTLDGGSVGVSSLPLVYIGDAGVLNVNFPATQPVSVATLPLPTGAATDATASQLLDGGVGLLGAIAANQTNGAQRVVVVNTPPPVARTLAGAAKVDGSGVTQPVSAVVLPLPAGAAQDATLAAILSALVSSQQAPLPVNPGNQPLNPFLQRCNAVRRLNCQP